MFKKTIWFPQANLVLSQETPADSYILTFIYKPQDIYVFWWQIWSERCFSWYLNSVWHKSFIFQLKQNGISGNLLSVLSDSLKDRKQRVILNGQVSSF